MREKIKVYDDEGMSDEQIVKRAKRKFDSIAISVIFLGLSFFNYSYTSTFQGLSTGPLDKIFASSEEITGGFRWRLAADELARLVEEDGVKGMNLDEKRKFTELSNYDVLKYQRKHGVDNMKEHFEWAVERTSEREYGFLYGLFLTSLTDLRKGIDMARIEKMPSKK